MTSPTVIEIMAEQTRAGQTNPQAAACALVALKTWEAYRAGTRTMSAPTWMLYRLRCAFPKEMEKLVKRLQS